MADNPAMSFLTRVRREPLAPLVAALTDAVLAANGEPEPAAGESVTDITQRLHELAARLRTS